MKEKRHIPKSAPLRVATLFSGIGAPEFALKRLSIPYKCVLACDNGDVPLDDSVDRTIEKKKISNFKTFPEEKDYVDKLYKEHSKKTNFVKQAYLANYGQQNEKVYFLDVTLLNGRPLQGKVDLLIGGSPCQSFSTVGFQKGLDDDRGNLFFEYFRLVNEIKPKVFIYENVSGIQSKKNEKNWDKMEAFIKQTGYKVWHGLLNAQDFGIPQVRNRLFIVGFLEPSFDPEKFEPKKKVLEYKMKDFLIESTEDTGFTYSKTDGSLELSKNPGVIDESYYLSPLVKKYVLTSGTKNWHTQIKTDREIARTLLSTMGNHHRAGVDNYVTVNERLRALSERECLRLMGFTDDFKIVVNKTQAYKQIGNSMVVDVMMALIEAIISNPAFSNNKLKK
jgi:DNA (cytosine-5)-methyltransferase 1